MNWQLIETAPKDGTSILGYDPLMRRKNPQAIGRVTTMRWDDNGLNLWRSDVHSFVPFEPTHWMPLPECPTSEAA